MRAVLLASVSCVAACSAQFESYVGPMNAELGPQVAADMAQFISGRIKPGDGPVQVEQPDGDEAVGPSLLADLQSTGFTVIKSGGKHRIRYAANTLGGDVIARVSVDSADGARMYRDKPVVGLTPLGPFTVVRRGE
jgi:hypothetical protein